MSNITTTDSSVNTKNNKFLSSSNANNLQNISIVLQNIRSIRKNFDYFLTHLSACDTKPSLIFLTEIWVYDYEIDIYRIDGYTCHSKCNNDYASGGVVVYIQNTVEHAIENISFNSADILRVNINVDGKIFIFICIYRLHFYSVKNFLSEISSYLNSLKGKNVILLGDLNIDILPPINNRQSLDYVYLMSSFGFESLINSVTRPSSKTCIDHVFYRCLSCFGVNASVHDYDITDHSLIFVNISHNISNKIKSNILHEKKN